MTEKKTNIEDAAHVAFYYPEYVDAIIEDLGQSTGVEDTIEEKLGEYSIQFIADAGEARCIEETVAQLSNLLEQLRKRK